MMKGVRPTATQLVATLPTSILTDPAALQSSYPAVVPLVNISHWISTRRMITLKKKQNVSRPDHMSFNKEPVFYRIINRAFI
jgi:hypothetical protein